jgi:predicted DsbA family dithiol-disulfide isomerase
LKQNVQLNTKCCNHDNKPLEIYVFVDPLCPQCWALEPVLQKLKIEYGSYFKVRHVLTGKLTNLNISSKQHEAMAKYWEKVSHTTGMYCDGTLWLNNPISSPLLTSLAIKAAELQGKRAGARFLRRIQEVLFLETKNVSEISVLMECGKKADLDMEEFLSDMHSKSAAKALQCDLKITSEMQVTEIPSLVFFNENIEDEGLKISGLYPYEVYVQVIQEMLNQKPSPAALPPLEAFLKFNNVVASKEVSTVYDLTLPEAEKELKKLVLQQKILMLPGKYGPFWRYIGED